MMVKSGLEKIILKLFHAQSLFEDFEPLEIREASSSHLKTGENQEKST